MNLVRSEKEILQLAALIARWKEQKYIPKIERDIALARMRQLYTDLMETEPTVDKVEVVDAPQDNQPDIPAQQPENCYPCNDSNEPTEMQIDEIASVIDQMIASEPIEAERTNEITPATEPEPEVDQHPEQIDDQYQLEEVNVDEHHCENEHEQNEQQASAVEAGEARHRRFIHDLFCNDETFYAGEMRKIEALPTLDDVLIYIGQKYAWSPTNPSAEEFVEIISSRFDN